MPGAEGVYQGQLGPGRQGTRRRLGSGVGEVGFLITLTFRFSLCLNCPDLVTRLRSTSTTPPACPPFSVFTTWEVMPEHNAALFSGILWLYKWLRVCQKRKTGIATDLCQSSLFQPSWRVTLCSMWLVVSPSLSQGVYPRNGKKKGKVHTGFFMKQLGMANKGFNQHAKYLFQNKTWFIFSPNMR